MAMASSDGSGTVTIERTYFDTLLRRAKFVADGDSTIQISRLEYDGLREVARKYENIRKNLTQNGVEEGTFAFLCQDESSASSGELQHPRPVAAGAGVLTSTYMSEDGGASLYGRTMMTQSYADGSARGTPVPNGAGGGSLHHLAMANAAQWDNGGGGGGVAGYYKGAASAAAAAAAASASAYHKPGYGAGNDNNGYAHGQQAGGVPGAEWAADADDVSYEADTTPDAPTPGGGLSGAATPFTSQKHQHQQQESGNGNGNADGRSQGQQFDRIAQRTLMLANLAEGTTHAEITRTVRGGMLLDVFLRSHERSATVSFLRARDAQAWFDHVRRYDLYIRNKRVEVKWSERQFILPGHVANKIGIGATRNLVVRRCDPRHSAEGIREDLEHIHNLSVVKVEFSGSSCFISLNSVHNAMFARTCMMSRQKYKGSKIDWDADECAQPLEKPQNARFPAKKMAPAVTTKPVMNRFQLLNVDSSDDDEAADDDDETEVTVSSLPAKDSVDVSP